MKLDSNTVLSVREQQNMIDSWQKNRLQNLLPALMKKHGIDMWIIACREDNQDPVLTGMLPQGLSADKGIVLPPGGNQIIIVFHELENGEVERLLISALKLRDLYKNMWDESKETEWECLERIVKEKNPTRIGLNTSSTFAHADGLTFTQYSSVMNSLRPFEKRVVSAEKLAVDWLQQRTKEELSFYPTIARIGHSIIEKAFSNDVIVPGKTTTEDVGLRMRQRIRDIGLQAWFKPMVAVSRKGQQGMDFNATIQRGDIIFCDIGLDYMGLQTDTQRQAYVLQERETEVPAGIQKAMQTCNQLQDGFLFECKAGRTGNDILGSIQENAKQAEIDALISSHPVGVYGHGPGACIGVWHEQKNVPVRGDYCIPDNTCYAMELCVIVPIPEWDNQRIAFHLEQTVAIQNGKTTCLDERQTRFYLIS